jgi:predicted helicase
VASFGEFLGLLHERWPDASERGTRFESYLCDALRASPSHQFTDVWLWDDWPGRDGPDYGIDLVAADADGGCGDESDIHNASRFCVTSIRAVLRKLSSSCE